MGEHVARQAARHRGGERRLHEWEHRIFKHSCSHSVRKSLKYQGLFWRHEEPLLITGVEGVDEHGEHFHYSARRHRTGQPMVHEILARQEDTQHQRAQAWWACFAFWRYHETPDTALAWWSGLAFILGGLLFAISGLAGSIRGVYDTANNGRWSSYAWLVGYTSIAGTDFFFLPGVIMVLIQSGNTDLSARVYAWERQGRTGRKPRYNWFLPFNRHSLMSWASWIMLVGKLCFSTAFTSFGLSTSVAMSVAVQRWLIWVPGTFGSVCFMFFGLCQCLEASHSFYKAIVPLFPSTIRSLGCWSACSGFWGGALFTVGSAGFLATTGVGESPEFAGNVLLNVIGYFIGSLFFMLGGFLSWLEISQPDSKA